MRLTGPWLEAWLSGRLSAALIEAPDCELIGVETVDVDHPVVHLVLDGHRIRLTIENDE